MIRERWKVIYGLSLEMWKGDESGDMFGACEGVKGLDLMNLSCRYFNIRIFKPKPNCGNIVFNTP